MTHPAVQPGYHIGRNEQGLTARERQVLGAIAEGLDMVQTAARYGITKQRVLQIVRALEKKGALTRSGDTITITTAKRK